MEKTDELEFSLYVMIEAAYAKKCEERGLNREELFPFVWYSYYNYHKKTEMLAEAMEKGVMLQELPRYQGMFF